MTRLKKGDRVSANTRGGYFPESEYARIHGRRGTVVRICGTPFRDHCRVLFDPQGRCRAKEMMMRIDELIPIRQPRTQYNKEGETS